MIGTSAEAFFTGAESTEGGDSVGGGEETDGRTDGHLLPSAWRQKVKAVTGDHSEQQQFFKSATPTGGINSGDVLAAQIIDKEDQSDR